MLVLWREIRRARCPRCGVTHAIVPEDQCACRDATLGAVERALDVGEAHPTAAARAAGQTGCDGVRRVERWFQGFDASFIQRLEGLLPPAAGTWLERVRQVVGPNAGALVRLRRWLWSTYRLFFGGPSGLWRDGRARNGARHDSTQIGSLTDGPGRGSPFVRGWG
jgi:hypothetical protein